MNPIAFLFNSIKSVHYDTLLLESCEWSDERFDIVKSLLESTVSEIMLDFNHISIDSVLLDIDKKLSQDLNRKEIEACLFILRESIDSFSSIKKVENYEN